MAPKNDDLFDNTNSSFVTLKDLNGCLIGYLPYEVDEIPTKTRNPDPKKQTFKLFKSHVVILDGKPAEAVGADKLPFILEEFGISGAFNENLLKDALRRGRPKVGRVKVEKNTAGTESAKIVEASDEDIALARKHGEQFTKLIELAQSFDA